MNISMIVTVALLGAVAVIAAVNILKGTLRGLKKTVGTLVAIILSALIAGIITVIIDRPNSPLILKFMNWLMGVLPEGGVREFLAVEAMGEAVTYYGVMLSAPFIFLVLFMLISIILSVVIAIVIKYIPPHKQPSKLVDRLGGAGVGLVCTVLVSLIAMFPIIGTFYVEGIVLDSVANIEDEPSSDIKMLVDATAHNPTVVAMEKLGCGALYNVFANAEYEGEKIYLVNEISVLSEILYDVAKIGGDMAEHNEEQKEALHDLVNCIDHSPIVTHALAGVLSEASSRWLEGEDFVGLNKISAGELVDPLLDELLVIISTTNDDTVKADLDTMADIIIIIMDSELLQENDGQEMLTKLGEGGLIADLLATVNANERMRPLSDEITHLSIRTMAVMIGVPENAQERYDMLMNRIADVIENHEALDAPEKTEIVKLELDEVFDDYGVEISEDALNHVAASMVADIGEMAEPCGDDVKEFFAVYSIGISDLVANSGNGSFALLSDGASESRVEFNEDGTITVDGVVLKNYTVSDYRDSGAFALALSGVDIGDVATLDNAENMRSALLTAEDILKSLGSYIDCADVQAESERVAEILSKVGSIFSGMDLENINYTDLLRKMGGVFDMMSSSEVLNSNTAKNIMTSVLQSDMIKSSIGLKKSELTGFADKVNEYALSADGNYETVTKAVSVTVNAITTNSDAEKTYEEKVQATEEMINNIDKQTAEVITSVVTDSLVSNMGIETANSDTVADSVQNLINNMADYKESAPTEEEVAEEAKAVTNILSLAMSGTNEGPLFDTEEEKGTVAANPNEFISTVVNSTVVMETVQETVSSMESGENPYGLADFDEVDKADIENALQNYYTENGGGEDLAAKLGDIAFILNVNFYTGE